MTKNKQPKALLRSPYTRWTVFINFENGSAELQRAVAGAVASLRIKQPYVTYVSSSASMSWSANFSVWYEPAAQGLWIHVKPPRRLLAPCAWAKASVEQLGADLVAGMKQRGFGAEASSSHPQ